MSPYGTKQVAIKGGRYQGQGDFWLHVWAYNVTRVMSIVGAQPVIPVQTPLHDKTHMRHAETKVLAAQK